MHTWNRWPLALRIIVAQAVLGSAVALLWLAGAGAAAAWAAVLGAAIAVVSNAFFASRVFLRSRQDPGGMLRGFVAAEMMKLALLLALFVVAIRWFAADFLPVISTYAATALVFLWALRWRDPQQESQGTR